jgi:hypothetical protein
VIGVESALRDVPVPSVAVARVRQEVTAREEGPLFSKLAQAGREERERLVDTLTRSLALEEDGTATSGPPIVPSAYVRRESDESAVVAVPPTDEELVVLTNRKGLMALRDTDGDGVTDYDEEQLYGTDPENPFTGGSVLTDGERLLLGLDPHASGTAPIVTQSPRVAGVVRDYYTVTSIRTVPVEGDAEASAARRMHITGMAPPLSFVTLYLYSTPVMVTVRADAAGRFEYSFDEVLEDGSHELYVATVNNTGKILAKSESVPFVKTAEAVSFTPPSVPIDPVEQGTHTGVALMLLLSMLTAFGVIILIGMRMTNHGEPHNEFTP